jgi:hypothetical protein
MAKKKKAFKKKKKPEKKRATKYENKLKIVGTLDEVLRVASNSTKKAPKPQ